MAKRRFWTYYSWATEIFGPGNQDEHVAYAIDGNEDVSTTHRTLLRTRMTCSLRVVREGHFSYPPGFTEPGASSASTMPFLYVYTYADGAPGQGTDPSILTVINPDAMPAIGRTTVAPVLFTGLQMGTAVYVPTDTISPVTRDPGWVTEWHEPADAGNSEGQRSAAPSQPLTTRLQLWLPVWGSATADLGGTFFAQVQQLVESTDV